MEQEAKDRAEEAELRRNAPGIPECLKQLFALPNWENRIGPWKDINDAIKQLHAAYTRNPKIHQVRTVEEALEECKKWRLTDEQAEEMLK